MSKIALISVSNKDGIIDFAKNLISLDYKIISTGGTFQLLKENNIDADVVVPIPDSGVSAAIGFSQKSNISFELGIIRSHYVGRTFIEPTQKIRQLGIKLKHNTNKG